MAITGSVGWTQAVVVAAVFVAWTLTSFLCHECGKMFLHLSEKGLVLSDSGTKDKNLPFYRFYLSFFLTTVQCLSCLLLVRTESGTRNVLRSRSMLLLMVSHVLATLATNYSLANIEAASTLAIKLTEPVTMAVAHHVIFQTAVPLQTALSIPLIIFGALVFTGVNVHRTSNSLGIALAFASNIILAARNVTLKKVQAGSSVHTTISLRPYMHIAQTLLAEVVFVGGIYFLETQNILPRNCTLLTGLSVSSGNFHVAYSYISTSIVLKVMNVVSHSIANIFKRFLVVLLLCLAGSRQISAVNLLGLVVAACGLLVYTHGKTQLEVPTSDHHVNYDIRREASKRKFILGISIFILVSICLAGSLGRSVLSPVSRFLTSDAGYNVYRESHGLYELEKRSTDFSHILEAETDPEMREFLSWRLVNHPEDTDKRAKTLTSNTDIVEEAQRILVNLLEDLLGKAKHVMLIEIATYENKGDPAITVGEVMLLRRMNINIVFYCETFSCRKNSSLDEAQEINKKYAKDELVILMQGGGNLVGYPVVDTIRDRFISNFPDRRILLFSQSIWLHGNSSHLEYCREVYSNRSNLIIFLRDRQSLEIAKANFQGVTLILAPDLAFCIGMVPRQMPPFFDIVWLKRNDGESGKYSLPAFSTNISVDISDWREWKSNKGKNDMENSFMVAADGFQFLQRGRIVVTDRLHGHILSILMDIPHVLIDNPPYLKLSSFDNSWTKSLSNTIFVSNGSLALDAAKELLKRYHSSLPSIGPKDMYVGAKAKTLKVTPRKQNPKAIRYSVRHSKQSEKQLNKTIIQ